MGSKDGTRSGSSSARTARPCTRPGTSPTISTSSRGATRPSSSSGRTTDSRARSFGSPSSSSTWAETSSPSSTRTCRSRRAGCGGGRGRGGVVEVEELVEEAVERAYAEVEKRRPELAEAKKREIAELVGAGALRYNIGRVQAEKPLTFRWEDALNFEGDSAPFLQYAHARACGILAKAGDGGAWDPAALTHVQEGTLIRLLARLPGVVASCATNRRVHPLAAYAYALAVQFQRFYEEGPVLLGEEPVRSSRLPLVRGTRIALGNALWGLGLAAPEEM